MICINVAGQIIAVKVVQFKAPESRLTNVNLLALQHEILYLFHKAAFLSLWRFGDHGE